MPQPSKTLFVKDNCILRELTWLENIFHWPHATGGYHVPCTYIRILPSSVARIEGDAQTMLNGSGDVWASIYLVCRQWWRWRQGESDLTGLYAAGGVAFVHRFINHKTATTIMFSSRQGTKSPRHAKVPLALRAASFSNWASLLLHNASLDSRVSVAPREKGSSTWDCWMGIACYANHDRQATVKQVRLRKALIKLAYGADALCILGQILS